MRRYPGGLGDKMEDWVERGHQVGNRYHSCLCTMQDLSHCPEARAKYVCRNNNPQVMTQVMSVQNASKQKFIVGKNENVLKQMRFSNELCDNRMEAAGEFVESKARTLFALFITVDSKANGNECKKWPSSSTGGYG
jgi:hypothetical protein